MLILMTLKTLLLKILRPLNDGLMVTNLDFFTLENFKVVKYFDVSASLP